MRGLTALRATHVTGMHLELCIASAGETQDRVRECASATCTSPLHVLDTRHGRVVSRSRLPAPHACRRRAQHSASCLLRCWFIGECVAPCMRGEARRPRRAQQGGDESERRLMVGLIGYPNVGKSSTINALFGAKKTAVAATPGARPAPELHVPDLECAEASQDGAAQSGSRAQVCACAAVCSLVLC